MKEKILEILFDFADRSKNGYEINQTDFDNVAQKIADGLGEATEGGGTDKSRLRDVIVGSSSITDELLPCPFCGGRAVLIKRDTTHEDHVYNYDIGCSTFNCFLVDGADWFESKDNVIKMWNKRA